MKVIGIDPSLTRTAVAIGDDLDAGPAIEFFGSKAIGSTVSQRIERYDRLLTSITAALEPIAGNTLICLEGYSYASNGANDKYLTEFGGLLRWHLVDVGQVIEVSPMTLKKWATGTGKGKKLEVAIALTRRYPWATYQCDDAYDAAALWTLALAAAGAEGIATNAGQRAVLETVRASVAPSSAPF